jgi:hypothetical protein
MKAIAQAPLISVGELALIGEFHPSRRVIARLFPSAYVTINGRCTKVRSHGRI